MCECARTMRTCINQIEKYGTSGIFLRCLRLSEWYVGCDKCVVVSLADECHNAGGSSLMCACVHVRGGSIYTRAQELTAVRMDLIS